MMDIVTLTCPSCGGKLQISKDLERLACAYCGNEHIVKRSGGAVSLAPVIDRLAKIEVRVDKTASELAVRRLREEISGLDKKLDDVKWANKITVGIVLMVVGGVRIFTGYSVSFGFVLVGLFCVIIGAVVFSGGMKLTNEEKQLEQLLKEKKLELKHHESILRQ